MIPKHPWQNAESVLLSGGILVFPTDTVYGLGCDYRSSSALQRMSELKGRPENRPFQLLISDREEVERFCGPASEVAERLMRELWPGGLTLLLSAAVELSDPVVGQKGAVGLRLPAHEALRTLIRRCGGAIAATSANRSGQPSPLCLDQVPEEIRSGVDCVVDGGPLEHREHSTVIDCTDDPPQIVRRGTISREQLASLGVE